MRYLLPSPLLLTLLLVLLLSSFSSAPCSAHPDQGTSVDFAPVYRRQRASSSSRRHAFAWGNGNGRYGAHLPVTQYGYYPRQPIFSGSYYSRPYPRHFDVYRWRRQPVGPSVPASSAE